jgi:prepilin-type N-terminal cleavage/methylation domain-containing protein
MAAAAVVDPLVMLPNRVASGSIIGVYGRRGFTLIEILIVVTILGILAMVVVPKFTDASQQTREVALADQLRILRGQIQLFRAQHKDLNPGFPGGNVASSPTESDLKQQMTGYTSVAGVTNPTKTGLFVYGPYLPEIPINPVNRLSDVQIDLTTGTPTPSGSKGWIYQPATGRIWANLTGADRDAKNFIDY